MILETLAALVCASTLPLAYKKLKKNKFLKEEAILNQEKLLKQTYNYNLIKTNDLDSIRQIIKTEVLFKAYLIIREKFDSRQLQLLDKREYYYNTLEFEWQDAGTRYFFDVCTGLSSNKPSSHRIDNRVTIANDYNPEEYTFWCHVFYYLQNEENKEKIERAECRKKIKAQIQQELVDGFFDKERV